MKKVFECIGVDAGNVSVLDYGYVIDNGGKKSEHNEYIEVENGLYEVELKIQESWKGNISKKGQIKVESGILVVGYPCYQFSDSWMSFLKKTNYLYCVA